MTRPGSHEKDERRLLGGVLVSVIGTLVFVAIGALVMETDMTRDNIVWGLVALLLTSALVLLSVAVGSYRRRRRLMRQHQLRTVHLGSGLQKRLRHTLYAGSSDPPSSIMFAGLGLDSPEVRRVPLPAPPSGQVKACRECNREFHTVLERCPFDHTKLVPRSALREGEVKEDYLDTRRAVMRCPDCRREFDLGAEYCTHDGEALAHAEPNDEHISYDGGTKCPVCTEGFDGDALFCPEDGARLKPDRPGRSHAAFGAMPLYICTRCVREFRAGSDRCPHCDDELKPLIGRTTGANPSTGFGPKTRVCPECAIRYSDAANYCADDGSELLKLS